MSIKTTAQAKEKAWKNRHWSRDIFRESYSYASEEKNDSFVDDEHIREIVDFLTVWSKFENNPNRLYDHLLVIYAIRNQPWNLSFPYDITEREESFWNTTAGERLPNGKRLPNSSTAGKRLLNGSNKKKFELAQQNHDIQTCLAIIRKMIDCFMYYFKKEKKWY